MQKTAVIRADVSSTPRDEVLPNGQQKPVGVPCHIDLPAGWPRLSEQTGHEGCHAFTLSRNATSALKGISEQEQIDLFMTLLAIFNILLARYTAQDIELSMLIIAEFHERGDVIRTFRSPLGALGASLSGDPTFRVLLRRMGEIVPLVNRRHEMHARMAEIRTRLGDNSTMSHLRQFCFGLDLLGSQIEREQKDSLDRIESKLKNSELGVFIWQEDECIKGAVAYKTELFDVWTIRRLAAHYATLLQGVADNPDQNIGTFPLLTEAEHQQLLVEWNDTQSEYPENLCVHQLFEIQARITPDAVAAVFGNQQLTYSELNGWANRLARKLQKVGCGPEMLVALCTERSVEMLVGILAILKAGGVYVPLDSAYPNKRLSVILSEAQPRVLLTQGHLISRFPEYSGPFIVIDGEFDPITEESGDNLAIELAPENLAYVIYTSGSTGIPKGVLIAHRSLVNHSTAMARQFDLRPGDRVLQFASFGFDVAAEEIFPTWLSGATVVLWPAVPAVKDFLEFIEQQEITVLNLPASYWHEWLSESEQLRVPPMVRLVIVGNDKVSRESLSIWKQQIGDRVRLYNAYGPTETTITATIYDMGGDAGHTMNGCVPIGRPIANTQAYVLDERLNPVPIGVPGELYIGGVGLARGYLNQLELSAERFIANPFCAERNARIYRTGDIVRYLPDGNLEYLGRIGNQVKLRGYRIELGEIEAILRQNPGVRDAAVIVREDRPGDRRLTAYVIQKRAEACTADELRDELRQRLPDYMMPSAFVTLDSFPLTLNGKVDPEAFPALKRSEAGSENFIPSRNPVERQLVSLWEELLETRPIGIRDNFFNFGGNSLLGLKLISRIRKSFGKNIPIAALYQAGTVEQLAKLISEPDTVEPRSCLAPIQTTGCKLPFFWVHGDSSNAFLPHFLGPDQRIYGLMHQSQDGKPARYTEVETIAAHYLEKLFTVQPKGPYFLGGFSFGGTVAFEMAQRLTKQGEEVAMLFLLEPEFPAGKISPPVKRPARKPLRDEARRHLHNLGMLGHRDQMVYILVRIRGAIKERMRRIGKVRRVLQNILCKLFLVIGRRIPVRLRSGYILEIYGQAMRRYVPQPYPGPAIYLKAQESSHHSLLGWAKLLVGELNIYELSGSHVELVAEPCVRFWAKQLKDALQRAWETVRAKEDRPPAEASVNDQPIRTS